MDTDRQGPSAVVVAEIRDTPLSVDEMIAAVQHDQAGAIATFIGIVRNHDEGHAVQTLDYTAHPSATQVLTDIADGLAARGDTLAIAAVHRVGHLEVGDLAVVVAVSAAHRGTAIEVCHELIDTIKVRAPIWKQQTFGDGSSEWVGLS